MFGRKGWLVNWLEKVASRYTLILSWQEKYHCKNIPAIFLAWCFGGGQDAPYHLLPEPAENTLHKRLLSITQIVGCLVWQQNFWTLKVKHSSAKLLTKKRISLEKSIISKLSPPCGANIHTPSLKKGILQRFGWRNWTTTDMRSMVTVMPMVAMS